MLKSIFDALIRVWDWIKNKIFVRFFNFLKNLSGFFKGNYKEVKIKYPKSKAIALKIDEILKSGNYKMMDLGLNSDTAIVNTYYNEATGEIIEGYTQVVGAEQLDQQTIDAFGDQDMLVLN